MKPRILIYDDDVEILQLCTIILTKKGFDVQTLSKCENILNDVEVIKPGLILMDLWIPEIGGEKAVTLLKNSNTNQSIPILLFSANPNLKEISERIGADGFIEKPFTLHKFIEQIQTHIS